jgi:hypothetical protein
MGGEELEFRFCFLCLHWKEQKKENLRRGKASASSDKFCSINSFLCLFIQEEFFAT